MSRFPDAVDQFVGKLDRRSVPYVIQDEVLILTNGSGERQLDHDNVKTETIEVWSGIKKTGTRINSYILSQIPDAPWKTVIRVLASVPEVYITYETEGDQVKARDINDLQQSIVSTQIEVLRHEADMNIHLKDGIIDGGKFR